MLTYAEQRALEIGITIAGDARIILLDEPSAGMSAAEAARAVALIRKVSQGRTLIMIEHDVDLLRGAVDSAAVLHLGALVVQGPMREIQQDDRVRELYLGRSAPGGAEQAGASS